MKAEDVMQDIMEYMDTIIRSNAEHVKFNNI